MVIAITRSGYIKRLPVTAYREQKRGGKGVMGMDLKEDDYIEHLFVASTHDFLLFFTSVGKVYRLKVHELPLGSRQSKGRAAVNLLPFRQGEQIRAVVQTRDVEEDDELSGVRHAGSGDDILMVSRSGQAIRVSEKAARPMGRATAGVQCMRLRRDDEVIEVNIARDDDDLLVVTDQGYGKRTMVREYPRKGR